MSALTDLIETFKLFPHDYKSLDIEQAKERLRKTLPTMSERKYTKQELFLAYTANAGEFKSYISFADFYDKTFGDVEKQEKDLDTRNDVPIWIKDVFKAMDKNKAERAALPPQDREAFLGHLETALLIMKVNVGMNDVEKIVAIYNCVKEHGAKTTIEDLRQAIG